MTTSTTGSTKAVFWHRDLPPRDAEVMSEHTLEVVSGRVPGTLSRRDQIWDRCYEELMARTEERLAQEITRLGGRYAHILQVSIDSRHDDRVNEAWLHGTFTYVLYR